ncbi:site-2 protease, Metallo peptidase, MEROPS family M50B [Psychromonas ingrahamii 37]|uniref:Zinc metalloprotease n=1 Tax=Psychromonas ingrahamii (strain DSM 17664 / CCUG 51855 / 37) TaxID=357804 RepID=A1SYV6_PSYIN|nr:sigma E protease regulator RseP [Psychromonas ingrahamii]ABM04671.1 site-2 protease, Metallo peptidase, MEROPS family M50B [Psychromonas ingrahamii 37]
MLSSLWNLGAFIVALSILVAVHEFGHFWVARKCGVKVHRFSIGFGKVLFKWFDKQGTEFAVAAIPLGGYVKMLDGRIDKLSAEDEAFAFDKKTVWQRIAIVSAGPAANFILAVIAFFFMYMIGVNSAKPIVETTQVGSPMSVLQDVKHFQVMAINNQPVEDWDSLNLALVNQIGENQFNITVQPLKESNPELSSEPTKSFTVSLQDWQFDPKTESIISSLGLIPYMPEIYLEVGQLTQGGAADKAGLQIGDKLLSIDGDKLNNWQQFVALIQKNAEQTLQLEIERGTITQIVKLTPAARRLESEIIQGHIGVSPVIETYPEQYRVKLQFGPLAAMDRAIEQTGLLTKLTFNTIVKLVSGDISVKNLSGPVAIAKGAGMSANYGIEYFLGFLALISVNLGLMNLIPLPVLDGGHLLYYFFEVVTGKAVPEKVQEIGFRIGGAILITLMLIAILNDFDLL